MTKTIPLLLTLALGGVIGFALSRALPSAIRDTRPLEASQVTAQAREILSRPEPLDRIAELSALLQTLGPEAVPAMVEAFDSAPVDGAAPELIVLATWWASFDPKAAFEWSQSDWRASYGVVIEAVFRAWAHVDPDEAFRAAGLRLRFPGQLDGARDAIYVGWDESGKPGIAELFGTLSLAEQQRLAQILARRRVVVLGVDGALQWAESFRDPAMKHLLAVRVASVAAGTKNGARKVSEWATPRIAAAKQPTGLPRRIGTRWVRHDPIAAMAWLASLPAGYDRYDGVAESFRDWIMKDFTAAVAWIQEKTKPGEIEPWCEPAVSIFAKTNGLARPEESLALAARLKDLELRDSTTLVLLVHWMRRDRAAAEAWLAQADLPADLRKRVATGAAAAGPPPGAVQLAPGEKFED